MIVGLWYGIPQALESAVHRGDAAAVAVAEAEGLIVSEIGECREVAWLIDVYAQLKVPPQFRRCDDATFEARVCFQHGDDADAKALRAEALAERRRHLARVRWNLEHVVIRVWRVLPGDPPGESEEDAAIGVDNTERRPND